ncbi:MAG: phage tail assembly chaperone [Flavobacteriales bacterium]|nr:phage tail assembly chaperone [Flavobacteriales bacterium]
MKFVQSCYRVAVKGLNISPSEFWGMKPRHFWWLVEDASKGMNTPLAKEEVSSLRKWMDRVNAT